MLMFNAAMSKMAILMVRVLIKLEVKKNGTYPLKLK